ncbi:MAG: hypothetical protein ACLTDS_15120 [Bianqueaceae bacterium]
MRHRLKLGETELAGCGINSRIGDQCMDRRDLRMSYRKSSLPRHLGKPVDSCLLTLDKVSGAIGHVFFQHWPYLKKGDRWC